MAGMPRRSSSGPPETFSPLFSPLCPWIHGLFPAIELAVAFSPSLPNPGDPRATLARASLNSGDLTAAERSSATRSRLTPPVWSPPFDPDRMTQIAGTASRTRALHPWPACQRPSPLALGLLGHCALPLCHWRPWPACQHSPAPARAIGRRSNLSRWF
jgi:hypothetical protein